MANGARLAAMVVGAVAGIYAIDAGQVILAPIALAFVIAVMLGPLAERIERAGIPRWLSAVFAVVLLLALFLITIAALAVPLSNWLHRLPLIWARLQSEIASWQGLFASIENMRSQLQDAMGSGGDVTVTVNEGSAVESAAYLAPTIAMQIVLFLAALYFFIASRRELQDAALSACRTEEMRRRLAAFFQDTERFVSHYMLLITAINIGLALAVGFALWLAGVQSAWLWGVFAGVLNYVIYIGPAIMTVILVGVGLATESGLTSILAPAAIFLTINLIEAQFVTPNVVGRTIMLNPLAVFLSLTFWIWIWGAAGGFVAIPALLIFSLAMRWLLAETPEFPAEPAVQVVDATTPGKGLVRDAD